MTTIVECKTGLQARLARNRPGSDGTQRGCKCQAGDVLEGWGLSSQQGQGAAGDVLCGANWPVPELWQRDCPGAAAQAHPTRPRLSGGMGLSGALDKGDLTALLREMQGLQKLLPGQPLAAKAGRL